jgi:hypothetical protein
MSIRTTPLVIMLAASILPSCGGSSSTSSEVLIEPVSAYDPENPCDGNALRITVVSPGAEPVVEFVCQGLDDHLVPELDELISNFMDAEMLEVDYDCSCAEMGPSPEECATVYFQMNVTRNRLSRCSNEALILYGEQPPAAVYEFFECLNDSIGEYLACMALADFELCDAASFDEAWDCADMVPDPSSCDPILTADEEATVWFTNYTAILDFLFCDFF